jgi:hypothetical protein
MIVIGRYPQYLRVAESPKAGVFQYSDGRVGIDDARAKIEKEPDVS